MANRFSSISAFRQHLLTKYFTLKTHMVDTKHQIRLLNFECVFGQQVLTKGQQNFYISKLQYLRFQTPCRPMLHCVYIKLWNELKFQLFYYIFVQLLSHSLQHDSNFVLTYNRDLHMEFQLFGSSHLAGD